MFLKPFYAIWGGTCWSADITISMRIEHV